MHNSESVVDVFNKIQTGLVSDVLVNRTCVSVAMVYDMGDHWMFMTLGDCMIFTSAQDKKFKLRSKLHLFQPPYQPIDQENPKETGLYPFGSVVGNEKGELVRNGSILSRSLCGHSFDLSSLPYVEIVPKKDCEDVFLCTAGFAHTVHPLNERVANEPIVNTRILQEILGQIVGDGMKGGVSVKTLSDAVTKRMKEEMRGGFSAI
eukprot:TRINITY_DN4142_c0_g1_i1.p1 TRINITY_DN4142_c0_g1~~TRINITY_DN4142_c0_g1_i1.p1  ORF type:complete len:205 (-),score=35.17 TRINITY_DN4142_c0_g1_i1:144-758(-)